MKCFRKFFKIILSGLLSVLYSLILSELKYKLLSIFVIIGFLIYLYFVSGIHSYLQLFTVAIICIGLIVYLTSLGFKLMIIRLSIHESITINKADILSVYHLNLRSSEKYLKSISKRGVSYQLELFKSHREKWKHIKSVNDKVNPATYVTCNYSMNRTLIFISIYCLITNLTLAQNKVDSSIYRYVTNVNGTGGPYTSVTKIKLYTDSTFIISYQSGAPYPRIRLLRNMNKFEPYDNPELDSGRWSTELKNIELQTEHNTLSGKLKKNKIILFYQMGPDYVEKVIYKKLN